MNNNINIKKKDLRKKQFLIRKQLFSSINEVFNKHLFKEFLQKINFDNINVVSSFISINSEINTHDLNNYILNNNKKLCLPVVSKKHDYLIFRNFTNENDLVDGFMNIKEPSITCETMTPELLFIPCLAFDRLGYRLGYGGGYYDKTLNYLKRNKKNFLSIGYAYDGQKVSEVPIDKFDIKLDYVITEKKYYAFI